MSIQTKYEFYQKYANIPLAERLKKIPDPDDADFPQFGISLNEIYFAHRLCLDKNNAIIKELIINN